ncbi:MAG: alkaline phosphatase [Eubacteriales bacterium]
MLPFFRYKQFLLFLAALALLACVGCGVKTAPLATPAPEQVVVLPQPAPNDAEPTPLPKPQLKYIFLFIGDGMGSAQVQAANEALISTGREPLCFIGFPVTGSAHTDNIDGVVTDSAAAATAIATGTKTLNTYLGLDSKGARLKDITEELRDTGRKIGVLTTVSLDHATPAGFFSHVTSRRAYSMIADDLFASGFDYFAGGGFHDTPDAAERAAENGYTMISSFEQAPAQTDGKLILSSSLIFGDYGVILP